MNVNKKTLVDIFCSHGGASSGYAAAGFAVTGVDVKKSRYYHHDFIQCDDPLAALAAGEFNGFDVISLSLPNGRCADEAKAVLNSTGRVWVMERAATKHTDGVTLCGWMFGSPTVRHTTFESNVLLFGAKHIKHGKALKAKSSLEDWVAAVGIDWINNRQLLARETPPFFATYVGRQVYVAALVG